MTNRKMHNLNLLDDTFLNGMSLIEASAGTGKTWNICMLFLRLLLEKKLNVSEILVVTFTNAATAELKGRIRDRLIETLSLLEGNHTAEDASLSNLIGYLEKKQIATRQEMQEQLKLAISHFDEASISTIHGFCQKVIGLRAFETGQPFSFSSDQKEKDIITQVVHDFWRKNIASSSVDKTLGQYLYYAKKITPEILCSYLEREMNKPLAEKRWPQKLPPLDQNKLKSIQPAYDFMKDCWLKNKETILDIVFSAIENKVLNGNKYKKTTIENSIELFDQFFMRNDPAGFFWLLQKDSINAFKRFTSDKLLDGVNKNQTPPEHPFFSLTEKWITHREELFYTLELTYLHLLFLLSKEVQEVRLRNKKNRILSFNGMLYNLYAALKETQSDNLKKAIQSIWKAALIDEFQDTDPIQFSIFNTIYGDDKNASVFFVGDPKQAIYRFRNADLHTYFDARTKVDARYSLNTNHRATPEVINACNVLFSRNEKAFIQHELNYTLVNAAKKEREVLSDPVVPPDKTASGMVVWYLPNDNNGGSFMFRWDAISASAHATANEILRLLDTVELSGQKLQARDIAILVRVHREAKIIQDVLSAYGLPSSTLSPGNVWHSFEAKELIIIFSAIINPRHQAYLRAALSTEILGFDALQIEQLENDHEKQLAETEKFMEYQADWIKHGISFVIRQIISHNNIYAKILSLPNGERRLTNILHLSELISEAAETYTLPESLLNWMIEKQQENDEPEENEQIRMESDENLIRIMTIHAAKGKEFKFVFCPFLWDTENQTKKNKLSGIEYQEDNWIIDFRIHDEEKEKKINRNLLIEDVSEKMRLIYVALTRAIYRCYIIAGCYTPKQKNSTINTKNMLNWLVNQSDEPFLDWQVKDAQTGDEIKIIENNWLTLAENCENIILKNLPLKKQQKSFRKKLNSSLQVEHHFEIAKWPEKITSGWRIGSYSNLVHGATHETPGNDYDEQVQNETAYEKPETAFPQNDILLFPASRYAGNCIHAIFENIDFTDDANWDLVIKEKLQRHPPYGRINPTNGISQEILHQMIRQMLNNVLSTELPNGILLNKIELSKRLTELEFFIPTENLASYHLEKILSHDDFSPSYSFQAFKGYIKGLIDLVIEHDNRFYILDWKSNLLGMLPSDYEQNKLMKTMEEHHYHLQYLVYSIALHRYLKYSKPDYKYETHFGGVLYLFVRGIRPTWKMKNNMPCGVFYRNADDLYPDIQKLDELISQGVLK